MYVSEEPEPIAKDRFPYSSRSLGQVNLGLVAEVQSSQRVSQNLMIYQISLISSYK